MVGILFISFIISCFFWVMMYGMYKEEVTETPPDDDSFRPSFHVTVIALCSIFWPLTVIAFILALICMRIVSKMRLKARRITAKITRNIPASGAKGDELFEHLRVGLKTLTDREIRYLLMVDHIEVDGLILNDKDKMRLLIYDELAERSLLE